MFGFLSLSNKKESDPLSSLKALTQWMESELPLGDVFAAHDKLVKSLYEFNEKKEPLSKERLQILMHLDASARELQEMLGRQYLQNPRMSREVESRLWRATHSYYWEATRGYHAFVLDYISHPAGSKIMLFLPQITARAMNYFAMIFKWQYFRYEKINEKAWKRLHNLYRFAEYEEFERSPLSLYEASANQQTTCTEIYTQALMLDVLNTGSLFPKQIEMVSGWLGNWASSMRLEQTYDPEKHVFYVDMAAGRGARRVRKVQDNDMCRYWSTSELISRIEQVRAALLNGGIPAKLGLSEGCRLPGCHEFLDEVALQWAATAPRVPRQHQRVKVVKMLEVLHGMHPIFDQVKDENAIALRKNKQNAADPLSYDEMVDVHLYGFVTKRTQINLGAPGTPIDPQKVAKHERWTMENESEIGYGATIDNVSDDWVRLGKLVGLKPERSGCWRIGVVRRLLKTSESQSYVGMEVLVPNPVAVILRAKQHHPAGYVVESIDPVDVLLPVTGIYVPKNGNTHPHNSLIIDPSEYAAGRLFELAAAGKSYNIRFTGILEKGEDWLRVGFELVTKGAQEK